jgi:tryptophan synthase alpha chain
MHRTTIEQTFAQSRAAASVALMPFVPAGYPDLQTTAALLPALERAGGRLIEIGIPFSDPIADGPVIQQAFTEALSRGTRVDDVLRTVRSVRDDVSIPLVAMVSYSVVYGYGVQRFVREAKQAGIDGLIVPDLPPPEAQPLCEQADAAGLGTALLVAPTTPLPRRRQIVALCSGFVYYLSVSGVTGERDRLPDDLAANVLGLRQMTDLPVCVGFGIHRREQVRQLSGIADGAIVGSALVRCLTEHKNRGSAGIVAAVEEFARHLVSD